MIDTLKFIVIEDSDDDRKEILLKLADFGFKKENRLGMADSYNTAKELLEEYADQINVVFLDLNLPIDSADGRAEKRNGVNLLTFIHKDLNRRPDSEIKVIVVSGEDLHDGGDRDIWKEAYKDTLVDVVQKANLTTMLKAKIRMLKKDPLRSRISNNHLEILDQYDLVVDRTLPVKERLEAARTLAIKLVMNEMDVQNQSINSWLECIDDLNTLIKKIEMRFEADQKGKRHVKQSAITTAGGWGAFLWRGHMVQHLYALNSYRNTFVHIEEQPFRTSNATHDQWTVPAEILTKMASGESVGKMVELIVKDLLEWYLPWHEQVYELYFHRKP
jgi:CheY-like chemotaxis protein